MLFKNTIFQIDFQYELSYVLVPLAIILFIYFPFLKPILIYHMVCVGIIGTIDTYLSTNKNGIIIYIGSFIFHLSLLLSLFYFKKYGYLNIYSVLLLIIANFIIYKLNSWPYKLTRKQIFYLYNFIYLILLISFYIIYK